MRGHAIVSGLTAFVALSWIGMRDAGDRRTQVETAGPAASVAGGVQQASVDELVQAARKDHRIEAEVWGEIDQSVDGRTFVVVMLQEPGGMLLGPAHRQAVKGVQDAVLARLPAGSFQVAYAYKNFAGLAGRMTAQGLAVMAQDPRFVAAGPDARGQAGYLDVSVPAMNGDDAQALGYTGLGTTVAVLDSGIDTDHADLTDDVAAGGWHYLNQGGNVGAGAEDDNGHGTNVAGIITSGGVVAPVGIAPDARILAIKVLESSGAGWLSDWAAGVDHVVSVADSHPRLCAINMSLVSNALYAACPCDNSSTFNQALQAAILAARNAGITTFVSSGNKGACGSMTSPACVSAAIAVAATYDQNLGREPDAGTYQSNFGTSFGACFDATSAIDKITCFSSRSPCNALAAPGRLILAPGVGGGLSLYTGTSQASPHAAGTAALMCQKDRCGSLTPATVVQLLKDTGVATVDGCASSPHPVRIDALAALNGVDAHPGDVTCDGLVNIDDYTEIVLGWGSCETDPCLADIAPLPVTNGSVDIDDLTEVVLNWTL